MRLGLFGGSFNPPHVGHLRSAIEAREALGLDRVDFIVAARPPHKAGEPMLSFEGRLRLLRAALTGLADFRAEALEGARPGPSYTCDTLAAYAAREPGAELFFLMGAGDLFNLPQWRRGLELGRLANLVVMPRQGEELPDVAAFMGEHGPSMGAAPRPGTSGIWDLPGGRELRYLQVPRLDISASDIRKRWRRGRSPAFLVPEAVLSEMRAMDGELRAAWGGEPPAPPFV